jgi:allantoin racemase
MTDPHESADRPIRIWHQSFTVLEDLPAYAGLLQRHADEVTASGTSVVLHGMRPGTYPSEYPGDHIRYSYLQRQHTQQFVDAALQAQGEGYDAFFIATIPDVGLEDIRTLLDIPVVGFGQASLLVAATLAPRVGIVNFIEALGPQLRRNAESYGLGRLLGPIVKLRAEFGDVTAAYADPDPLVKVFREAAREAIDHGARVVIPGEGPLNVFLADHGITEVDGIPVIDSIAAALSMCELRVRLQRTTGLSAPTTGGLYHDRPPAELVAAVHAFYGEAGKKE